jgi:hypothetical protein
MKRLILLALLFFLFAQQNIQAQGFNKKNRYTSIGGSINAMNYVGDLDPGPSVLSPGIKFTRENFGLCIIQRMWPRVSLRASANWGVVKGSDAQNASYNAKDINRKIRNLNFRSQIMEFKFDVIVDLWENRGKFQKRPDYTPYFFAGINYFHMNPKGKTPASEGGNYVALQPLHTEGKSYSLNQIAVPIGLGFRYKLSKQWDLAFEMGWRFTLTDYLDDVSVSYTDPAALGDPNSLSNKMANRTFEAYSTDPQLKAFIDANGGLQPVPDGNGGTTINTYGLKGDKRGDKNRDWYIVTGFHLTYILPGKVICPKFR